MAESVLDDEEKAIVKTEQAIPTQSKPSNLFMEMAEEEEPEAVATINRENIEKNPAVRNAAVRFAQNRLGREDVSEDDAVDEFVEHFRKFNINEMTAAGDFNYVSGLASDATGKTKLDQKRRDEAKQELADYRLLYTTFQDLPNFHGGKYETFLDYAEGILKAPSTYIGLALPGAGKAGGLAATTAAKAATQSVLSTAFKTLAPIVLGIAAPYALGAGGLGLFSTTSALGFGAATALGTGLGSLLAGQKPSDALKSALISGVTAGVTKGIEFLYYLYKNYY